MSDCITFMPVRGITLADAPTEDEPSRHRVVRNCRYTLGFVEGRDSECTYCLEDLEETDHTVTHNECLNAFHDHCFDEVLKTNPNLLTPGPVPSKCPVCNGLLYPWPALVDALPPAEAAAREAARERAAAEARRRELLADLQAERAFAETDIRMGLGPEAAARIEARLREEAEAQRRDFLWEIQAAIALAETEGRTLDAEARRRDLRAEIQAARVLAETEGRTLGQPAVDREDFLRERAAREIRAAGALAETEGRTLGQPAVDREEFLQEQAADDLEHMELRLVERDARVRAWREAATCLVLARNPGIQRDFVLLDEIEVNPATWDQQDIARRQSIIDRLGIAMAEGDTEVHVIRARLERSQGIVEYEFRRLDNLSDWAFYEQEAQEPHTEMWQEATDALHLLEERFLVMWELLDMRALYYLPWEDSDDDRDSEDDKDSNNDEIPDV
jgi:hypothetical protein